MGLPIWARWVRVKGALKQTAGEINVQVTVGGATINPGDVLVLDADGVAVVPQDRVTEVLEASAGARGEGAHQAREAPGRRQVIRPGRPARRRGGTAMSELRPPDIAHLGPIEIFTPKPQESLEFFTEMMGMEVAAPRGPVGLPARLGRLPDLVAEADRGSSRSGHGVLRPSHLEPGGARAARRADRGRPASARAGRRPVTSASAAPTASRTRMATASRSTTRSSAT